MSKQPVHKWTLTALSPASREPNGQFEKELGPVGAWGVVAVDGAGKSETQNLRSEKCKTRKLPKKNK